MCVIAGNFCGVKISLCSQSVLYRKYYRKARVVLLWQLFSDYMYTVCRMNIPWLKGQTWHHVSLHTNIVYFLMEKENMVWEHLATTLNKVEAKCKVMAKMHR